MTCLNFSRKSQHIYNRKANDRVGCHVNIVCGASPLTPLIARATLQRNIIRSGNFHVTIGNGLLTPPRLPH